MQGSRIALSHITLPPTEASSDVTRRFCDGPMKRCPCHAPPTSAVSLTVLQVKLTGRPTRVESPGAMESYRERSRARTYQNWLAS